MQNITQRSVQHRGLSWKDGVGYGSIVGDRQGVCPCFGGQRKSRCVDGSIARGIGCGSREFGFNVRDPGCRAGRRLVQARRSACVGGEGEREGLPIEILINNAGFGTYGRFDGISGDREQELIALNIGSLVELTHQFLPDMVRNRTGVIVNVASLASFLPTAYMAVYSASKAFILSFSEALWAENRHRGVRIVALCPGPTQTDFFNEMGSLNASGRTAMASPERVVQTGLRGIEKGRSHIIDGTGNHLSALMVRLLPRKWVAMGIEKMTRPFP